MRALWRLRLALNRSLLYRECVLINVLKALASIISMCNLHVISLSKITTRYFALYTNGISRRFNMIFQRSHQVSIQLKPAWNFLTIKQSVRSGAYRQVSSSKRARCTPSVWGASFIYILKSVGDKTEPCGTPACITLGFDISSYTETLNFLCER
jgi:hypothetical protein